MGKAFNTCPAYLVQRFCALRVFKGLVLLRKELIALLVLIVGIVVFSGCIVEKPSCAQLNGKICTQNQQCTTSLVSAGDSERCCINGSCQNVLKTGKLNVQVTSERTGDPIEGANVAIFGKVPVSKDGAPNMIGPYVGKTDSEGKVSFTLRAGDYNAEVSAVGFLDSEKPATVINTETTVLEIALEDVFSPSSCTVLETTPALLSGIANIPQGGSVQVQFRADNVVLGSVMPIGSCGDSAVKSGSCTPEDGMAAVCELNCSNYQSDANLTFSVDNQFGGIPGCPVIIVDVNACSCTGKACGDDGCGHFCGGCIPEMVCISNQCVAMET